MLEQERLRVLAALYDRKYQDIATAVGISPQRVSDIMAGRFMVPTLVRRIELAIIGAVPAAGTVLPDREAPHGPPLEGTGPLPLERRRE